jgi:predicted anti-sigma-YlaC factor YlaD
MDTMDHEEARIALMGYLDGELDEPRRRELEAHLDGCDECRRERDRFRSLKEVMDPMKFKEPSDQMWDEYWTGVYNRLERGLGWIFVSIASIVLISYGLIEWIKVMLGASDVPLLIRGGIVFLVVGIVVLLVSVVRERLFLYRRERYKEVKR